MRNPQRIARILTSINTLWLNEPDLRLMQFLTKIIGHSGDHFYVEDDVLEARLDRAIREWAVQLELEEREAAS